MKKILILLSAVWLCTAPAPARPASAKCPVSPGGYTVNYPDNAKLTDESCCPLIKHYEATSADHSTYGVMIFEKKAKMSYPELKQWLQDTDTPVRNMSAREVMSGKVKGFDYTGIDVNGLPTECRIFVTRDHSFVVWGTGYDLTANRKFVESFRLR